METKTFSRSLYTECDTKGKQASIKLLESFGYTLKDDTEAYKERDIIMTKDNVDVWIEAEYSPSWKSNTWPSFWSLTCPYRKKDSKAHLYIRINESSSTAIVIPMEMVHSSPVIRKDTKYTVNERFFKLDLNDCDVFNLSNVDITTSRYIKT